METSLAGVVSREVGKIFNKDLIEVGRIFNSAQRAARGDGQGKLRWRGVVSREVGRIFNKDLIEVDRIFNSAPGSARGGGLGKLRWRGPSPERLVGFSIRIW